jgi:hypothetical protein
MITCAYMHQGIYITEGYVTSQCMSIIKREDNECAYSSYIITKPWQSIGINFMDPVPKSNNCV